MKTTSVVKTLINVISILIFAAASFGCNGKIYKALLDKNKSTYDLILMSGLFAVSDVQVMSINSVNPDTTYGIGSTIDISVTFSGPVTLENGVIDIVLNSGQTLHVTSPDTNPYDTFTGTVTVNEGDTTNGGRLNATSISLASGRLYDDENVRVALSLPAGHNLTDPNTNIIKNIIVDGIRPVITSVVSSSSSGIYGSGSAINITVNFSEKVSGTLKLTLNSTSAVYTVILGGLQSQPSTYNVQSGDTTSGTDLVVTGIVTSGTSVADGAGNVMTSLTFPAGQNIANNTISPAHIDVNGISPVIKSMTSSTGNGRYGTGSNINVTIEFNSATTLAGVNGMDVTLDTGAVVHFAPFASALSATATYTVASGQASSDLQASSIALGSGATLRDGLNNDLVLSVPGDNFTANDIVIDGIAPRIDMARSSTSSGLYGSGANVNVRLVFTEPVKLTGAGGLNVTLNSTNGAPVTVNIPAFAVPSNTADVTYHVSVNDTTAGADLTVTNIALGPGSTIIDNCDANPNAMANFSFFSTPGNIADNTTDPRNIKIDGILPTVTRITSTSSDGSYGIGSTINVQVQFSKNLTLAGGTLDVTLNTGDVISINTINNTNVVNATYTVGTGDNSTDLSASSVALSSGATLRDAANNNAAVSLPDGQNIADLKNIVVDTAKPTIASVTSTTATGAYGTGAAINVTVNFSEPVVLTGGGLNVTLNSVNGVTPVVVTILPFGIPSGTATATYTVAANDTSSGADLNVTGIAPGSGATLTDAVATNPNTMTDFSIPAGQNLANDADSHITIDGILPVISSINSSTPDGTYGSGSNIIVELNLSKPVTLAGGALNMTLDTGDVITMSAGSYPAIQLTGTYTVGTGDASADLNVTNIALGVGATLSDSVTNSPNNAVLMPLPSSNLANNKAFVVDGVLPVITSITSSTSNGTYGAGANIDITINFNKAVTLAGGTLDITLDTGAIVSINTISNAVAASGSYTVSAGQSSADLNVTDVELSGGTLRDSVPNNPNDANLALPSSNLANNKAIVIDGVAPVISSITSSKNNGRYGIGTIINVTVNFSKNVTLAGGNLNVTLDTGAVVNISPFTNSSSASGTYTVGSGQTSADLNVSSVVLGGGATVRDTVPNSPNNANLANPAGNLANNKDIIVDTTAPTITSVTSSSGDGVYGIGTAINVTVNFSEPVTLSGTLNVTLDTGDVVSVSGSYPTSQLTGTYTIGSGDSSADLNSNSPLGLTGSIVDTCNENTNALTDLTIPGGQNMAALKAIVVNSSQPTIASITSTKADGRYGIGSTVNVTVNFSEAVDLAGGNLNVTLDTGDVISITPFANAASASANYTVGSSDNSADLHATGIVLSGGTLKQNAPPNNDVAVSLPGNNFSTKNIVIDTTAPTISSVTSSTSNGTYGTGSVIDVTVNFSEQVTLSGTLNVTLSTGHAIPVSAGSYPASQFTGSYTVVAGDSSADLNSASPLSLTGSIIDSCNENTNSLTDLSIPGGQNMAALKAIVVDGVAPTISSITSSTGNGTYGTGATVDVTVDFSKNVTLAGGNLNVTLDTGTVVSIAPFANSATASGIYTVTSGQTSADLNVTNMALSAGTLRDTVPNNPNNASLSLPSGQNLADNKAIVINAAAPYITSITSGTSNGTYGIGAGVNITMNFNRQVTLTGGTLDVTLNSGEILHVGAFGLSNPVSFTYTVIAGDTSSDLDVTNIVLGSGASLKDAYNNTADLSLPASSLAVNKDIVIDGVAPVITSITSSSSNGSYGIAGAINLTINFSKNVTLAGSNGLNITLNATNGAQIAKNIAAFGPAGNGQTTYTVSLNDTTSGADLNATLVALGTSATLKDVAGNDANLALPSSQNIADLKDIKVDGIRPTITSVTSMTGNGTYATGDNINVTVYFSESVTLSTGTLDVALNSGYTLHIPAFGTAASASGTYTVAAGNTTSGADLTASSVGTSGPSILDGANNAMSLFTIPGGQNIGDLKDIQVDGVLPAITTGGAETMDVDHDGRIDYYKITFNKNVKDSTFPGYVANSLGSAQTNWLVAGYTGVVLAHGTAAPEADTPNDTIIYLKFNEISTGYDTGVKPDLTTTLTPGLTDTVSTSGNALAQVNTATVVETDKAAPIIVASSGVTGTNVMAITFSEQVDGNGSGGGCSANLAAASFAYVNDSGGGASSISSMGGDTTACDDNKISVILNTSMIATDISPTPDHVHAALNAIYDMNNNVADSSRNVAVTGAISPYVLGVTATAARKIRITYSEPVDNGTGATGARNLSNYAFMEDPTESGCAGSGTDTVGLTGTVTEISSGTVFELSTDADQCSTTTYRLTVSNVVDVNDGVAVAAPTYGTFMGNERLKVASASCLTTSSMLVVFNKAVQSGTGTGGAEATSRYKFTGATNLGATSGAVRGSGSNTNQVTLTHSIEQTGGSYTVIGSNAVNADGFDDVAYGAIQNEGLVESLQLSPRDRSPWTGCGTAVEQFEQGPIATDPFGDLSPFGYLATYHGQVYVGPNTNGNGANRFNPDGSNPVNLYFEFTKDTSTANGTGTHSNGAATRDGGIAVPPYVTIGHSGCTSGNGNIATGCGPDNEDGRGLFVNGTISGTEYLFITGGRSAGDNDYLYQTTDTDTTLNFSFVDLSATFDPVSGNRGTESITIFNDKVYWMEPGNQGYRPYFMKLNNLNAQSSDGTDSVFMEMRYMPGIGNSATNRPNRGDRTGGILFVFNSRLYLANSGSVRNITNSDWDCPTGSTSSSSPACINNGGIIRSSNTDPAACSSANNCANWVDITPGITGHTDVVHNKFTDYFSKIMPALADLIPADRPIPGFAEYKGNLFMIRNACTTNMINSACTSTGTGICTDDVVCPSGNEVPQLWKCVPGTTGGATDCDIGDWSLVAENGTTGRTNMGDVNNKWITLLIRNGDYLYIGFDNPTSGLEIWRTNVANPSTAGQFEQIGGNGLTDPTRYLRNFSAVSMQQGIDHYLYVSAGDNSLPLAIFRQKNN